MKRQGPPKSTFPGGAPRRGGAPWGTLAPLLAALPCQEGPPRPPEAVGPPPVLARFSVLNPGPQPRTGPVGVSIPFPRGEVADPSRVSVLGHPTAWRVLTRWPDGSVQWAQAQVRASLGPGETWRGEVVGGGGPAPRAGERETRERLAEALVGGLRTEVEDLLGGLYTARLPPLGDGEVLVETPLQRVVRLRTHHLPTPGGSGIARDFLSVTAYVTLPADQEHGELLLVLGNDYRGADRPGESPDPDLRPLGPVRLRRFSLRVGRGLELLPRFAAENRLRRPVREGEDLVFHLLGPGIGVWLGDATAKAWSFVFHAGGRRSRPGALAALQPLGALPYLDCVRRSGAFHAHGGPAPPGPSTSAVVAAQRLAHRRGRDFGPFGGWGDPRDAAASGTPRNGPSALHQVLRGASPDLLEVARGRVLQQALRPYHLFGLDGVEGMDLFLDGLPVDLPLPSGRSEMLGRRHLPPLDPLLRPGRLLAPPGPHGFTSPGYEHFSVDLLYDFYCLTGCPFAREELRLLGEQLKGLVRTDGGHYSRARSSRGEGWCMKALVLCHLATGDDSLKELGLRRLREVIDRDRGRGAWRYAVAQDPHPAVLDGHTRWDAPWQQAAFVMGMHAAWRSFEDPLFARVGVDVAHYMATAGWVEGVGPKYFVDAGNPDHYAMAVGYGPLEGTALFLSPAFVLAAEMAAALPTEERARSALFLTRARQLFAPYAAAHAARGEAGELEWFQVFLDRFPGGLVPGERSRSPQPPPEEG